MMKNTKTLIINFVKEHQKGLKIALLVFLVGGMIFKGHYANSADKQVKRKLQS